MPCLLYVWIKQYLIWFFINSWWFFSGPALAVIFPFIIYEAGFSKEMSFNFAILFLRIAGFVFIMYGINKKLKKFTSGGIYGLIKSWWKSRPGSSGITKFIEVSDRARSSGKVTTSENYDLKNATLEERVAFYTKKLELLDKKINNIESDLRGEIESLDADRKSVENKIKSRVKELGKILNAAFTGNVKLELFGAFIIIISFIHAFIIQANLY